LRRLLAPVVGDVEITTLYRWLRDMEAEGLVESRMEPGPHGPPRRVYRVAARGESRLRLILRDAISVLLHFYDAFRRFTLSEAYRGREPRIDPPPPPGPLLLGAFPGQLGREEGLVKLLERRAGDHPLHVLGDLGVWGGLRARVVKVDGEPWDIACRSNCFAEFWLLGLPPRRWLPRTVVEAKRVLKPGGILRLNAPFVFFDEPAQPMLEAFLRVTAYHLFPELGVAEGDEIGTLFELHFRRCGAVQLFPGYVQFWGVKEEEG